MARLTVLGSCGAWPEPGRACAGFLLSHDDHHVVLDLGYGAASRLFSHVSPRDLDAVVVTHEHPDHVADLTALGRAWHHTVQRDGAPKIPLHCPPGVLRRLEAAEPHPHPATIFDVHLLSTPGASGPWQLSSVPLPHHVPNHGVRLSSAGTTVAYSGDTGPSLLLVELARDADLLICEATLHEPPGGPRHLMTAAEAGRTAAAAGVGTLLLTHFWPGTDRAASAAQARGQFDGEVLVAEEDLVLEL
ncbi:MBL fold metallo-hydrolase [Amycolatopsis jiangsuensis]|uniref:Ribonuclease BN (tRNA processing enzyme) n=1 Tax=Amycolatopsis jiangsuensis TaxID=1181879 RepID=A0A840IY36_9PSEU|nr:MBL fold metallo-hydrolase [Amycolatopsis jiangsuensis]MBB4686305.1 ribonuclease BN (tRNA processing enzyme) [Amycolatopsis jiangsuensis]